VTAGAPDRVALIRERLQAALAPESLDIQDDSAQHAGHAGARSGGGHFKLTIVADGFRGKSLLERHRLVYEALGGMMSTEIHALSISAYTPDEL
jgi:BolA protein